MVQTHKVKEPSPVPHQGPHSSRRHGNQLLLGSDSMVQPPQAPLWGKPLLLPILPERVCCQGASRLLWAALMDDSLLLIVRRKQCQKEQQDLQQGTAVPCPLPRPCSLEANIQWIFSSSVSGMYHNIFKITLNNNVTPILELVILAHYKRRFRFNPLMWSPVHIQTLFTSHPPQTFLLYNKHKLNSPNLAEGIWDLYYYDLENCVHRWSMQHILMFSHESSEIYSITLAGQNVKKSDTTQDGENVEQEDSHPLLQLFQAEWLHINTVNVHLYVGPHLTSVVIHWRNLQVCAPKLDCSMVYNNQKSGTT